MQYLDILVLKNCSLLEVQDELSVLCFHLPSLTTPDKCTVVMKDVSVKGSWVRNTLEPCVTFATLLQIKITSK